MVDVLTQYSTAQLVMIGASIFVLGMSKGGFPAGVIAIPFLVLIWPGDHEPAKSAVAFMLPMLCIMDIIAVIFYRRHILWDRIKPLMPGTIAGVIVSAALFVSKENALLAVPDFALKFTIGIIGILFVIYRATQKWVLKRLAEVSRPTYKAGTFFGLAAGLSSTLAHAASPVMQMYLLPQNLEKMNFAATTAAYFWMLNLIKMIPFATQGRIEIPNLILGAVMLPLIPLGVASGYWLVTIMKPKHYIGFIYSILAITSVMLVYKSFTH